MHKIHSVPHPSSQLQCVCFFFFFNDTATTEIYTLSLHDALPICTHDGRLDPSMSFARRSQTPGIDRKSTRLNSSHLVISYAVFCLKKKEENQGLLRKAVRRCKATTSRQISPPARLCALMSASVVLFSWSFVFVFFFFFF